MKSNNNKISEKELQKAVQFYLSDPSKIIELDDGIKIQVLSPGRINLNEGPDFLEIALLVNSKIIIGDAEFHFASSNWVEHSHNDDERYNSVILHIVFKNDVKLDRKFFTLVLKEEKIIDIYKEKFVNPKKNVDIFSLEELQNYSLVRLLRHTTEAQKVINEKGLEQAIIDLTQDFLNRYYAKKRRPFYNKEQSEAIMRNISGSLMSHYLKLLSLNEIESIADNLVQLLKTKIAQEGLALRREIILNVFLPLALTQTNEETRVQLFIWYWSTPSLNKYGVLSREFPNLPQNFLWQQQGMLEYIKELQTKASSVISDALNQYGVTDVLEFLHRGNID
jgi:hypothetical protein